MASDGKGKNPPRQSGSQEARQKGKSPAGDRPFDMWLQKQLHAMYDEIAGEPLPDDLLDMIDRDAAHGGDTAGSKGKPTDNKKS